MTSAQDWKLSCTFLIILLQFFGRWLYNHDNVKYYYTFTAERTPSVSNCIVLAVDSSEHSRVLFFYWLLECVVARLLINIVEKSLKVILHSQKKHGIISKLLTRKTENNKRYLLFRNFFQCVFAFLDVIHFFTPGFLTTDVFVVFGVIVFLLSSLESFFPSTSWTDVPHYLGLSESGH